MVVAGEASGDLLAAELVRALRDELLDAIPAASPPYQPLYATLEPQFFGAGGPRMTAAGVNLAFDMSRHAVVGLWEPVKALLKFRRFFRQLYALALERRPNVVVCVDFGGFNLHFAHALRRYVSSHSDWFHDWQPKLVQYVSPQVWASRPWRARRIARDYDLLLSTLPFEKDWYAARVPALKVVWVGHPIVDRYRSLPVPNARSESPGHPAKVVLLPGSRRGELSRHLPVLAAAAKQIASQHPAAFLTVLPSEDLVPFAKSCLGSSDQKIEFRAGGLPDALARADLALSKSGTVTLECAWFGVPAVVLYKTSTLTYIAARRLAKVKHLAMPNLLAREPVFPEFIQGQATPENIARAGLELLRDQSRRGLVKQELAAVVKTLGQPGAALRAARAIASLCSGGGQKP